jgi:GLPGLI family protein
MKRILITLITTVLVTAAYSQNPDKALARVSYTFTHIEDTTQKDRPHIENMLLITGKNASLYTSYDKVNQTINMNKQIQEQIKNNAGGNQNIKIESKQNRPITQLDYFFFANEHKMVTKERLFNTYLVEESTPVIDWAISKDTANFSGVHCQKATAHFKGRNWIAWFAPEIPFQSGPWKLNGLPGLIIEAYDDKKEVQFQFAGLENVKEEPGQENANSAPKTSMGGLTVNIVGIDSSKDYLSSEIKLPTDAIKTTRKDLDKLKAARDKDPQGFMQAQMAASGINGSFRRSTSPPTAGRPIIVVNNPIELPEKK